MKKQLLLALISIFALTACEVTVYDETPIIIDVRDQYIGTYRVEEYSDTYNEVLEYSMSISKSAYDGDIIFLHNFYGVDIDVLAQVRGDYFVIPLQEINGYEIEGEGWYEYNELQMDYVVTDLRRHHVIHDYCTAYAW